MKSKYKVTAMVPMQFPVAGNFDSEEAIITIKDIFEMCRDNGNYADIVFNGIEDALRSGNIKYQVETVTQPQSEVEVDSDTRSLASDICDIFENYLDANGICIVCDDEDEERERKDNESGAMLYGMEYWHLVEDVEFHLGQMSALGKPVTTSKILKAFDELLASKNLGDSVPSGENRYQLHSKILSCLRSREEGLE